MIRLNTVTVFLRVKTQTGVDSFGFPVYEETETAVPGVLVGEPTTDDITTSINLYGKKAGATLAIPKGDTHTWTDTTVRLPAPWSGVYKTIGVPRYGIEENIPLIWNGKVLLEKYG